MNSRSSMLQQCTIHRDTIINFTGYKCPLCCLIRAVKTLSIDILTEAQKDVFDKVEDESGIDLQNDRIDS